LLTDNSISGVTVAAAFLWSFFVFPKLNSLPTRRHIC
jgi:hypothetical protein